MFVAPFSVPTSVRVKRCAPSPRPRAAPPSGVMSMWLLAWLMAGLVLTLGVPALRGNERFGATLPFWLIGAPLLDLGWLWRARLMRVFTRTCRKVRRVRASGAVRVRCSAAR
jgi:hypothetical protein